MCTCTHTHTEFGSLWPQHTERLWLGSPAFYSMLLRLLTNTHRYTLAQVWAPSAAKHKTTGCDWGQLVCSSIFSVYIFSPPWAVYLNYVLCLFFLKEGVTESASQALEQQQATKMRPFQSLWGLQLSHCIITWPLSSGQKHSGCLVPHVTAGITGKHAAHNGNDPVLGIFHTKLYAFKTNWN